MSMMLYTPRRVTISRIIRETPNIKTFVFEPQEAFTFRTGQFVELSFPGKGEAPFTPSSSPHRKDEFEVTIMEAGRITRLFHEAKEGLQLGVRGPYGTGYPVDTFKGRDILIVGGGVGLAPLRSLIYELFFRIDDFRKVLICYGARTPDDIVYKSQMDEFRKPKNVEFRLTVDKAGPEWKGHVGLVTSIVDDIPFDVKKAVGIVCGPPIMMKFSTLQLLKIGFLEKNIYLSMEKNMSCGLGKCGHCRLGKFYCCKDGPVFSFADIKDIPDIWE